MDLALTAIIATAPLAVLLVWTMGAAFWGGSVARKAGSPPLIGGLYLMAIGLVIAATGLPDGRDQSIHSSLPSTFEFFRQLVDLRLLREPIFEPPLTPEQFANIVLYMPAGYLGVILWHRIGRILFYIGRSIGVVLVLSLGIEAWQPVVGRSADWSDVRNNVVGAAIGAAAAALYVRSASRNPGSGDGRSPIP